MIRFHLGLIGAGLATLGCAAQQFPDDPFSGPVLSAPSSIQPTRVPEMPAGTYESAPAAYPHTGPRSATPPSSVPPFDPSAYRAEPLVQTPDPSREAPDSPPPMAPSPAAQPLGWKNTVDPDPVLDDGPAVRTIGYDDVSGSIPSRPAPIDGNDQFRGRDSEYRWISGTLQYVAMDRKWQVRYAPYSVEDDRFGGSLLLEEDPRLAEFEGGEVVYVEGELVHQPTRMLPDNAVYRIKSIQKVSDL